MADPNHRSEMSQLSRRGFLQQTVAAGATAAAAPYFVPSAALGGTGRTGANDKISVGVIGCGSLAKGWHFPELDKLEDVKVSAVCDVWKERLDWAVERCQGQATAYRDYRELLARDDIDAVLIATPPFWHALMSVHAAEAGKDFYVEKPMTMYVDESMAVVEAARRHKRITQVGTQIHADDNYRRVVEYVRSGNLGKIPVVRTFMVMNQGPEGVGNEPGGDPPPGLDWEMWIGPAPMRPFHRLLIESAYSNCSFMAYSGGWTPGMAPHIVDLPVWALELGFPKRTLSSGGRYVIRDVGDSPDTHEVLWEYDDFTMTWWMSLVNSYGFDFQGDNTIRRRLGVYFQGVNGTLWANYGMHQIVPEGDRMEGLEPPPPSIPSSPGQHREWIDGIRTRTQPLCNVAYHHAIDVAIGLANLSLELGREVRFDPATRKIVGDPEAARRARPEYRDPWKFPAQYL